MEQVGNLKAPGTNPQSSVKIFCKKKWHLIDLLVGKFSLPNDLRFKKYIQKCSHFYLIKVMVTSQIFKIVEKTKQRNFNLYRIEYILMSYFFVAYI